MPTQSELCSTKHLVVLLLPTPPLDGMLSITVLAQAWHRYYWFISHPSLRRNAFYHGINPNSVSLFCYWCQELPPCPYPGGTWDIVQLTLNKTKLLPRSFWKVPERTLMGPLHNTVTWHKNALMEGKPATQWDVEKVKDHYFSEWCLSFLSFAIQ